jgi:serine phosphatase RsbU (regulator of sigma subunit)
VNRDVDTRAGSEFATGYAAALRAHVADPGEGGLRAAYEFGRRALASGFSMLDLVAIHLECRRQLVAEMGVANLRHMDDFLAEALASFDVTQEELVESQRAAETERQRADWLGALTDVYTAISAKPTLDERLDEVCVQAKLFLGAVDAQLVFGGEADDERPPGDVIEAELRGGGILRVMAAPGRSWTDANRIALHQLATLISAPVDDARRLQLSRWAGEVGRLLGGHADPDEMIARLHGRVAAEIGASWIRLVRDGEDPDLLAEARSVVEAAHSSGEAAFENLPEAGPTKACAGLPLGDERHVPDVLVVGFDSTQPFDDIQRAFLVDVSGRVNAALERSAAYARERTIRRHAEEVAARLRQLEELAADLGRAATRRRVALLLLRRAVATTSAAGGAVIATRHRDVQVLAASGPFRRGSALAESVSAVVEVIQSAGASDGRLAIPIAELPEPARSSLRALGMEFVVGLRMAVGAAEVGLLVLGWPAATDIDNEIELLQAQVDITAPNLLRAERFDVEHDIAETLQRSIIELPPLTLPGIDWSVFYRTGSAGLAGGDWYDVIAIDDEHVALAIGDIVGRGVQAAASMGQVRSATRALAGVVADPAQLLTVLDRTAAGTGHGRYSSLAYAVLEVPSGTLSHSLAGHLPPALRHADGSVELLAEGRGGLLGADTERCSASSTLNPGTQVVMYTDGLVERRGESIDAGLERLLDVLAGPHLSPAELCRTLVERLLPDSDADDESDDVAILVVEVVAIP